MGVRPLGESPPETASAVIWHDLECGLYRADLPLWQELAARADPRTGEAHILEVGSGTGRVALELARRGHTLTAVDIDAELLGALRRRGGALPLQTVCADARSFQLQREDHALCLVPMQTLQLLGGAGGRAAFLERARAHLQPGGLLACAIVTDFDPFDAADGDTPPSAESMLVGAARYSSRALRVSITTRQAVIERERRIVPLTPTGGPRPSLQRNVVALDLLSAALLQREALAAGLSAAGIREIPPTPDHVGSTVVILRA